MKKLTKHEVMDLVLGWATRTMLKLGTASGAKRQSYHLLQHVEDVTTVGRHLAKVLCSGQPEEQWLPILQLGTVCHDLIQNFSELGNPSARFPGVVLRQRDRGPNEDRTAEWVMEMIMEYDPDGLITIEERHIVFQGIYFTYPVWFQDYGTMGQPRLFRALEETSAHPIAVSIAGGDLLGCGCDDKRFMARTDGLGIEEAQGLVELFLRAKSLSGIPPELQAAWLEWMRDWDAGHAKFVEGQRKLTFAKLLDAYPRKADELQVAFDKFDASIARANKRANSRLSLNFEQYAEVMGFPMPA